MHTFAQHYLPSKLETYWAPVRVDFGQGEEVCGFPMFNVHELFAMLWDCDAFGETCFGSGGFEDVACFWQHVSHEDQLG